MIITIDGPAASGKSSAARELAQRLHMYYLYTGLLYRAVAYLLMEKYKNCIQESFFAKTIDQQDLVAIQKIIYCYEQGKPQLLVENKNITSFLENATIDQISSVVAVNQQIRETLLPIQRALAQKYDLVADGRDCGSVVFPDADYKFFLTASLEERTKRAIERKPESADFEKVQQALAERDARDTNREVAPLKIPEHAIVIDNSKLDLAQTIEVLLGYIKYAQPFKLLGT